MMQDRRTWAKVPAAAICDPKLSNAQFRTLAVRALHADRNGRCRLKVETVAQIRSVSRQQIQNDDFALKIHGYQKITPTMRRCGGNGANTYEILYPEIPDRDAAAEAEDE